MKKTEGLTAGDRIGRIGSAGTFVPLESDQWTLLSRAVEAAGFLRYHNLRNLPEGYFRELLPEMERLLKEKRVPVFEPDGNMEPAQVLLYLFVRNLKTLADTFNRRWKDLPYWYYDQVLKVRSRPEIPYNLWVSFTKGASGRMFVDKGREFLLRSGKDRTPLVFRTTEDIMLENPVVARIRSIYCEKHKKLYPASLWNMVTTVEVRDPSEDTGPTLFRGQQERSSSRSPGFLIASPQLLLREGERTVNIRLETESKALTRFIEQVLGMSDGPFEGNTEEEVYHKLLENIFSVRISVESGWLSVGKVSVRSGDIRPDNLMIRWVLPRGFPATAGCTREIHGLDSVFPAVEVCLKPDAWLYPYSWIRDFILKRIVIYVQVEGLASLKIYNELGRVDNSKPFLPFGLATGQGAWFVMGNYEMAVKKTDSVDLHIEWGQLPTDPCGFYGHYRSYGHGTDNCSFRITPRFLRDHRWQEDPDEQEHFLFASTPPAQDGSPLREAALADKSVLRGIRTEKMLPITIPEAQYDYTIHASTGFLRLVLCEPATGFGEDIYRQLFPKQVMRDLKRNLGGEPLNLPVSPQIARLSASYRSHERIELRECDNRNLSGFWHIHPLGLRQVYPDRDNPTPPLICSLNGEAHLVFALSGVRGGECLRLWFDFSRTGGGEDEASLDWFWGDGYRWEDLPDEIILGDGTADLSKEGLILLDLPKRIDPGLFDDEGMLWFRAAVIEGAEQVPRLRNIFTNAVELTMSGGEVTKTFREGMSDAPILEPGRPLAGIREVTAITPVSGGRRGEDRIEKMARVSEYVTHRGRAVTTRDYERITLEEFPELGYVRCFSGLDARQNRRGGVTVVVLSRPEESAGRKDRPSVSVSRREQIRQFLLERSSPAMAFLEVISPDYEEVMIRGRVVFVRGYPAGSCRTHLKELCDRLVAPWQAEKEMPSLGRSLDLAVIRKAISGEDYVASLRDLSVIRIVRRPAGRFFLDEHVGPENKIWPSTPYTVFVPAREHIFPRQGEEPFGVGEMAVDRDFIVGSSE